ncbi:hypothetical protein EKPJFOCH_2304 [Methylobacterium thuringiense]|uniref:TonB-dependent receptor plug domain-containing protein n=1 Tax=Methylobacterium thuringiense TaxID=1003091 RepID=A0ABQ4TLR8_9HYPH|nr:hypothetical protein EKPJFOCH_2304 [Methylobacterium thuringiense]
MLRTSNGPLRLVMALAGSTSLASIPCAIATSALAQPLPAVQAVHPGPQAPSVGGVTLDMISVAGTGGGVIVDSSGAQVGYIAKRLRSATKTDTALIDTPQAISIVTQQQIRDQNVQSIGEALRYVPGVSVAQGEGHRDETSSAASARPPTSSSTASATTPAIFAISTTPSASRC